MNKRRDLSWLIALVAIAAGFLIGLWAGSQWLPRLSGAEVSDLTPAQQDEYVTLVALGFAQTGNLEQARSQIESLQAPNPGQMTAGVIERRAAAGAGPQELAALAQLAAALGVSNSALVAYLPTPTLPPTPTPVPPTPTPPPTATPVIPTATPTHTPEPATATPTVPAQPMVIALGEVNVRSGPGLTYAIIGDMTPGEAALLVGRNPAGDWWQVQREDGSVGWVLGQLVTIEGNTEGIPVAEAPPPPTPTRVVVAPAPTQPRPTPPPPAPAAPTYAASVRLRPVGQDSQRCDAGDHNIFVTVVDAAGNALNGVRVREIFTGQIRVTGDQGKGAGRVEFDIYRGGGGQVEIVDEGGNRIGEASRGMSADWPDFDLMLAAGYCNCKPHADPQSCQQDLQNKAYLFAVGHYAFEVLFRRNN